MAIHFSCLFAQEADSASRHLGYAVDFAPGHVLKADQWVKMWLKDNKMFSLGAEVRYNTLPSDSDAFAADYNYPVWALGVRFGDYNAVTMHKDPAAVWGKAATVDYDSHTGCIYTLYGSFIRPLYRSRHWMFDYSLSTGAGYCTRPYDENDNVDNELIGSHWNIFFGAGLHATYRVAPHWGVRAGIEFMHHSNGALDRPNKGANMLAPSVALVYEPDDYDVDFSARRSASLHFASFRRQWYLNLGLGIGGKTLFEEWNKYQYQTDPGEDGYRKSHYHLYATYSAQADVMCRYARRWASGLGVDLFYGEYAFRVRTLEEAEGISCKHSPWSVGIAAKHEVYYHNLSLAFSLGYYLYREMGASAKEVEQPYYERVGLFYCLPRLHNLTFGANVKAHRTKADYTEFVIRYPINIKW